MTQATSITSAPRINCQYTLLFAGLGWCAVVLCIIYNITFTMMLSHTLYYLGMSFTSGQLPWASCNNSWNTPACTLPGQLNVTSSTVILNMTPLDVTSSEMAFNDMEVSNETDILFYNTTGERLSAAEEFWLYEIIPIIISSDSIVIAQPLKRLRNFLIANAAVSHSFDCY